MNTKRSPMGLLLATATCLAIVLPALGQAAPVAAASDVVSSSGLYQAPDGTFFRYTKTRLGGTVYESGDLQLDAAGLRAWEASHPRPVVDPLLLSSAENAAPGAWLDLAVFLRHQPAGRIARQVRAANQQELDRLAGYVREVQKTLRPATSLTAEEELALAAGLSAKDSLLSPMQLAVVRSVAEDVEALGARMRQEIRQRVEEEVTAEQDGLARQVESLEGVVTGRTLVLSSLVVRLPANRLEELTADARVARVEALAPGAPELDLQGVSLGLTTGFWPQGLNGGTWDAGVLDTGVQQDHPALNPTSWLTMTGTTDPDGHGTAVAGIILSDDATYRGMAYGLDTMLVGNAGSATVMNHADWMVSIAADDPEAINLSFGYGRANDQDYSSFDQFWDGLVDGTGTLLAKSAGNGGDGTTTITHPAPAYNILAVANMDDKNTVTRSDDGLRSTSSRGPTLAGRKKPDIAAPGHNTTTTNRAWAGAGADFINFTGTSAAAPHVAGAAVLVTEIMGARNPMAAKAVLLNAADAFTDSGTSGVLTDDGPVSGSEWNKTYGWGYLDLLEAWVNGTDVFTGNLASPDPLASASPASSSPDGPPPEPPYALYVGDLFTGEKATLVWNRHVTYDGSSSPTLVEDLSDLDLYAYVHDDGSEAASSTSLVDNVEQVAAPDAGEYVLKVKPASPFDPDVGTESFALATEEGFEEGEAPVLFVLPVGGDPVLPSPGQTFPVDAVVENISANLRAHGASVELTLPPGFSLESGSASQSFGAISPQGAAVGHWVVRASCAEGLTNLTATADSSSYGETFEMSANLGYDVSIGTLVPGTSTIGTFTPHTYEFPVTATAWTGVGVDGDGDDKDLSVDDELCLPSPYQTSAVASDLLTDLILVNGRTFGNGTHYALVGVPAIFDYVVEAEHATSVPVPLSGGSSTVAGSFDSLDVLDVYEASLAVGQLYFLGIRPDSGLDLSVFGFQPGRSSGGRQDADYASQVRGEGKNEGFSFQAPASGWYGFAVTNDGVSSTGTYTLTLREGFFADGFDDGTTAAWSRVVP
jgi:serine protease AprX